MSRRDFIKLSTAVLGSIMGAVVGIPAIGYLIAPALREDKAGKPVAIGNLKDIPVGKPFPFSFTVTKVNGWERTASSYGGFVIRKSETDMVILSSRCTHLSCRVNWKDEQKAFICPCHDAAFDADGKVLNGPPPHPLGRFEYEVQEDSTVVIIPVEVQEA
jgi:cytochrome b6-f complex iron-sulfur subunit